MEQKPVPTNQDTLDGWKTVAGYLGKSVRTAQRYRRRFGMPVHRLGDRDGEQIFAYRAELDDWRRRLAGAGVDPDGSSAPTPPSVDAERPSGADARAGRLRSLRGAGPLGWRLAIAAAVLAAIAVGGWWVVSRSDAAPDLDGAASGAAAVSQPARYAVSGDRFLAYDARGAFLWGYTFDRSLRSGHYEGHADPQRIPPAEPADPVDASRPMAPVQFADLDGDGNTEVLVVAYFGKGPSESALYCLDRAGSLRWRFTSTDTLSFGGERYGAPTFMPWVTSLEEPGGRRSVWLAAHHQIYYPTIVYRLDAKGEVLARYVSNGRVEKLRFAVLGGRRLAFFGGVNNERKMAALAVYDISRAGGATPAETAAYRCDLCPPGGPDVYLLFPGTDVAPLMGGMPWVDETAVTSSGEVAVSVIHLRIQLPGDLLPSLAEANYRLDAGLRVKGADVVGKYIALHDYFFSRGRLDHGFSAARDGRQLWPVLRWDGAGYRRIAGPER